MRIVLKGPREFDNNTEYRNYLKQMATIKTPKIAPSMGNDEYEEIAYQFTRLRNRAKDKLEDLARGQRW